MVKFHNEKLLSNLKGFNIQKREAIEVFPTITSPSNGRLLERKRIKKRKKLDKLRKEKIYKENCEIDQK